jgi:class 3 adenylate cyclase
MKAYAARIAAKFLYVLYEYPLTALGVLFVIGTVLILGQMLRLSYRINNDMAQAYATLYLRSSDQLQARHAAYDLPLTDTESPSMLPSSTSGEKPTPPPGALAQRLPATPYGGVHARLYSRYPFPWRTEGQVQDAYEHQALLALERSPQQIYVQFAAGQRQWLLRAAAPVRMEKSCIECHNTHPASPKRDWQVGDLAGVQEVIIPQAFDWKMVIRGGLVETVVVMFALTISGLGILALTINKLRSSLQMLSETNAALQRFVPHEFLACLNKASIVEVQLADHVQRTMTILFSDIRSFTTLSEKMTPEENFHFINAYLSQMGPIVREHRGFIDKYIGDAVMALFDTADDAMEASVAMLRTLARYNHARAQEHHPPLHIGIGLNTGTLMLGTIGEQHRMEGTVISDAVNLAAHMEGMTKIYDTSLLISENTFHYLSDPDRYLMHIIDKVKVKGKVEPVTVFGVFDGESTLVQQKKRLIRREFERGVVLYQMKLFNEAKAVFETCLHRYPDDKASALYIRRCEHYLHFGWDEAWDGAMQLEH